MSAFSEGTLEKVRSKDLGEVGELLNGVVVELKGFDEEEEKGIKGFFKKKISKAQTLKLRYSKIEGNIDAVSYTHLDVYKRQVYCRNGIL